MEIVKETFGENTGYEANFVMSRLEDEWCGYIIFSSPNLSPVEEGGLTRFAYLTPRSVNGALCRSRAHAEWLQLCDIFKGLRGSNENDRTD